MKARVEQLLGPHRDSSKYHDTVHLTGVVDWQGHKKGWPLYGVIFEELKNPAGKNGRFYYTKSELALFEEEEDMKKFDWNDYKVAQCILNGLAVTDTFAIANQDAEKIKAESFGSPRGVTMGNRIVNITRVVEGTDLAKYDLPTPREELKAVFDLAPYEARQKRREKKAELKKQMDQRVKEIQSTQIYEMLAEKDETLAALLKEFTEA